MLGTLRKMRAERNEPIDYFLPLGDISVPLSPFLGKTLHLRYQGNIFCTGCGRKTPKSYNQGYCYVCFRKLAANDMCILKPETCHYHLGTCREPEWADQHCMVPHIVYLANSSGLKVGITRATQLPTRWIDQGASQALPIFRVATRYQSGLVEVLLAQQVADKTNWQALLKGDSEPVDLEMARNDLLSACAAGLAELTEKFPAQIQLLPDAAVEKFSYPVLHYPLKVKSFNMDSAPDVVGTLTGIKGQYLIFDTGVINIRKYTAYQVELLSV
ncbi:MAG: DUF2797 domain-containing protein [Moraxellaceae bacterium]|nr:DUF2797 domain-containing protein [Moraxellaceae bacterium]